MLPRPKNPAALYEQLPTTLDKCLSEIRNYGSALYHAENSRNFELAGMIEDVLAHLRYRYIKVSGRDDPEDFMFTLNYEYNFPEMRFPPELPPIETPSKFTWPGKHRLDTPPEPEPPIRSKPRRKRVRHEPVVWPASRLSDSEFIELFYSTAVYTAPGHKLDDSEFLDVFNIRECSSSSVPNSSDDDGFSSHESEPFIWTDDDGEKRVDCMHETIVEHRCESFQTGHIDKSVDPPVEDVESTRVRIYGCDGPTVHKRERWSTARTMIRLGQYQRKGVERQAWHNSQQCDSVQKFSQVVEGVPRLCAYLRALTGMTVFGGKGFLCYDSTLIPLQVPLKYLALRALGRDVIGLT